MLKPGFKSKSMFKRIFNWMKHKQYRQYRRISDHRATSMAVRLALTGALTPPRLISTVARGK